MSGDVLAEAVEAAAAAVSCRVVPGRQWSDTADEDKPHYREEARAALAAALPVVLAKLADRINAEERRGGDWAHMGGLSAATRIVRAFAAEVTG